MIPIVKRLSLPTLLLLLLPACKTPGPAGPTATCPVCDREGDLACLRVPIVPDTPFFEYEGQRYYFCSEECRKDFCGHPGRFVKH